MLVFVEEEKKRAVEVEIQEGFGRGDKRCCVRVVGGGGE